MIKVDLQSFTSCLTKISQQLFSLAFEVVMVPTKNTSMNQPYMIVQYKVILKQKFSPKFSSATGTLLLTAIKILFHEVMYSYRGENESTFRKIQQIGNRIGANLNECNGQLGVPKSTYLNSHWLFGLEGLTAIIKAIYILSFQLPQRELLESQNYILLVT
ncbi:Hypothetical_protein [Hexamita inflata]|uniref:Hypothetical_protein n=1 Tax=Hexamita inflata TaxID=28002 RepID=A0AA86U7K5_9EUKA|nr:Hypothetical protein HINF_LOCUS33750 [Hexamita inflata]